MADDGLRGPLLRKPIDSDRLREECANYDRPSAKRLTKGELSSYNEALAHFREMLGIRVDDEESHLRIDLRSDLQVRVLIDVFLNPWGCRLPMWSAQSRKLVVSQIGGWWDDVIRSDAAKPTLPVPADRLGASQSDLSEYAPVYGELNKRMARGSAKHAGRPAAASKILYILRPHFFLPWDRLIRDKLEAAEGTGEQYVAFLGRARLRIGELLKRHGGEAPLLKEIGQRNCTVVEAINKYCWSVSRLGAAPE